MGRRNNWIRRGLISLAALLVGLLIAEGITRSFGLAPTVYRLRAGEERSAYRLSPNPVLGYVLKPNHRDDEPDLHNSFPRTNAHGFRDIERTFVKPAGVRRILLLGDSVVVGHGIRDLNDTISRKLEDLLAPEGIQVLNFAVGGYCTASEVELLATRGLEYDADLVIVLFTENDYLDWNTLFSITAADRPRWAEALFVHSHFFRFLAITTNLFAFREAVDEEAVEARHRGAIEKNNVLGALQRLDALSRSEGFGLMIAEWPTFIDGKIEDRHRVQNHPDLMYVELVSHNLRLPCFRLSPWFREDLPGRNGSAETLYTIGDGMHPNPLGSEIAARAIAAILHANPGLLGGR